MTTLADLVDLSSFGVDVAGRENLAEQCLRAASDAVRAAAGSDISAATSIVDIVAPPGHRLPLPSSPVVSVSSVTIGGAPVDGWHLVDGALWRRDGWRTGTFPTLVQVTFTHGYNPVPADVTRLVCMFAAAAMSEEESRSGVAYESIDDYRVGYGQGASASASVLDIPVLTRDSLRARFGPGQAFVTGSRS